MGALHRTPVKSSQIKSIGYDRATKRMHIEFPDGSLYEYSNVGEADHRDLMRAKSIGSHFIRVIKRNPQSFPFTKLK